MQVVVLAVFADVNRRPSSTKGRTRRAWFHNELNSMKNKNLLNGKQPTLSYAWICCYGPGGKSKKLLAPRAAASRDGKPPKIHVKEYAETLFESIKWMRLFEKQHLCVGLCYACGENRLQPAPTPPVHRLTMSGTHLLVLLRLKSPFSLLFISYTI